MNIKHLAALATAIIATSTFAGSPAEKKCSAGTCSKKEVWTSPAQLDKS